MESLSRQSLPPAEIVIADAGSTDGTAQVLDDLQSRIQALRLIHRRGDRSTGRNAAIGDARNELIACIDGGCVADTDWLERLCAPLKEGASWVAGFYRPVGSTLRSTCIGLAMVPVREELREDGFLPSARSMAFRRSVWEEVGGFPEGAAFGEDTLFAEKLLAAGHRPVLAVDAVVDWRPPPTWLRLVKTGFSWGRGDGELGLDRFYRMSKIALYLGTPVAAAFAAVIWPPAVPLTVLPLAIVVARRTRHRYRAVGGGAKYFYIPMAALAYAYSGVFGYIVGRLRRS